MNNHQKILNDIYKWGLERGLVRSKGQFAKELHTNQSSLSMAMGGHGNGKGKLLADKATYWKKMKDLESASDWAPFRRYVAKDILCSIISQTYEDKASMEPCCELAVEWADKLINVLRRD